MKRQFVASIKLGFNNYTAMRVEASNRLEAYNKVVESGICGKEGKILSIKEL